MLLHDAFRDDRFDARDRFDFSPNGKSPFNRQQYGGSFGGPIKKDHTFFFSAVERFDESQTTFVNLLQDPNIFRVTPSQAALFDFLEAGTPFAAAGAGLRAAFTTTAARYPRTFKLFNDASGQVNPGPDFQRWATPVRNAGSDWVPG